MLTGLIIIIIASIQVTRNSTSIYKLSEIFLSEFAYCIVSGSKVIAAVIIMSISQGLFNILT